MAVFAVVMSMFILICVGSVLDSQSLGPSTCSMTPDSSSSFNILLS